MKYPLVKAEEEIDRPSVGGINGDRPGFLWYISNWPKRKKKGTNNKKVLIFKIICLIFFLNLFLTLHFTQFNFISIFYDVLLNLLHL